MQIHNFFNNDDIQIYEQNVAQGVSLLKYNIDLSVSPAYASQAYFMQQMNVLKKQAVIQLANNSWILSSGAMQWMAGNIEVKTDIKGAGDLFKKALSSQVTGEAPIKPLYSGTGLLVLEPTYKHLLIEDLAKWGGSITLDDGLFLATSGVNNINCSRVQSLGAAVATGSLFNTRITGNGLVILESPVPREEIVTIDLNNDVLKIDGDLALAWSSTLQVSLERTTKTLIGSAASGEGLVHVFRGTGRVLMSPVMDKVNNIAL